MLYNFTFIIRVNYSTLRHLLFQNTHKKKTQNTIKVKTNAEKKIKTGVKKQIE